MVRDPLPILAMLLQVWGVEEPLKRRFLRALVHTRWTETRDWYRAVQLAEVVGDRRTVAEDRLSPAAIVKIVELLAAEGRLERWWAARLEEKIFLCTDATGAWK